MALDIVETTINNPKIKEFILITRDSDFIPVLQRLQTKSKQTVVLVDEQEPQVHATYSHHADIVIPARIFKQAANYEKPVRGIMGWLVVGKGRATTARRELSARRAPIDLAVDHVIRVTSLKPNRDTARKEIESELRKIRGFSTTGRSKYLGRGTYPMLMKEIQKRTDRIKVSNAPHGGVSVRYIPKDEG